jgi:feruloyl esterase
MLLRGSLGLLLTIGGAAGAGDCAGLKSRAGAGAEITRAEVMPAAGGLPAYCRVEAVLRPSADSHIQVQVWLPVEGWNGKFQGVGNGGFAGSISADELAKALKGGYASASTDTGHQGGGIDAGWALGHWEKVVDFGHRAIHEMTVFGKATTASFYGTPPKRSYFSSCSNGGRQALMEAQRYPADYDGIVAGAPANDWTGLMLNAVTLMQATTGDSYIPAGKLAAIQGASLSACDAKDGWKDGIAGDPSSCLPDFKALLCRGADEPGCLTEPQARALRKAYDGTRTEKGRLVFPGYSPGGEAEEGGWGPWITGPRPEQSLMFAFGTSFYKNIVFQDAKWDYRGFSLEKDGRKSEKAGQVLNATQVDLTAFRSRGGKLILYHGWSDAAIPARRTVQYYEDVRKTMGAFETEGFLRLYMAPGVQHCGGGSGPNAFGQVGAAQGPPTHDLGAALERWVEQDAAPKEIIATRYEKGTSGKVLRTRPLCPYPQQARYKGSGSPDEAANWRCAAPPGGKR